MPETFLMPEGPHNVVHYVGDRGCQGCDYGFPVEHQGCGGLLHISYYVFAADLGVDATRVYCDRCQFQAWPWDADEAKREYVEKQP